MFRLLALLSIGASAVLALVLLIPRSSACTTPPCQITTAAVCSVESRGVPRPTTAVNVALSVVFHNASDDCTTPSPLQVLTIGVTQVGGPGTVPATLVGFPATPFFMASGSSLAGTLRLAVPANALVGVYEYEVMLTGVLTATNMQVNTKCTARLGVFPNISVVELMGNCGHEAGVEMHKTFRLQNNTPVARTVTWEVQSRNTSSADTSDYRLDDGSSEAGLGVPAGGETAGIQIFDALSGTDEISSVGVSFGLAGAGNGPPVGTPFGVGVWEDPNDDGNLSDAVLLTAAIGVVSTLSNQDRFHIVPVPAVQVAGKFAVGTWIGTAAGDQPAAVDTAQASAGRAFLSGSSSAFDPNNLVSPQNDFGLHDVDTLGNPGVLLLKANAGTDNDNYPIVLAGDLLPPGDPSSTVVPTLTGTAFLAPGPGTLVDISVASRSFPACHNCSNGRYTFSALDQASGDSTIASSDNTVLPATWTGVPVKPSLLPVIYCTPKVGSCGPLQIFYSGMPSMSNPGANNGGSAFIIGAAPAPANQAGVLIYSTIGPNATPFQGGFLCVQPPVRRTPPQSSGGSFGGCNGAWAIDMNNYAFFGPDPLLRTLGQFVWTQYWGRDPQASFGVILSDGLQYIVLP